MGVKIKLLMITKNHATDPEMGFPTKFLSRMAPCSHADSVRLKMRSHGTDASREMSIIVSIIIFMCCTGCRAKKNWKIICFPDNMWDSIMRF